MENSVSFVSEVETCHCAGFHLRLTDQVRLEKILPLGGSLRIGTTAQFVE